MVRNNYMFRPLYWAIIRLIRVIKGETNRDCIGGGLEGERDLADILSLPIIFIICANYRVDLMVIYGYHKHYHKIDPIIGIYYIILYYR
jgi:hypothetical protein